NIVLADQGDSQYDKQLQPAAVTDNIKRYYPKLSDVNITNAVEYDHASSQKKAAIFSSQQDVRNALASVDLNNQYEKWRVKKDLLGSDRFATEFVVETEVDGTSYLRFGDDILGKKPPTGFSPSVSYRIGNGTTGNVGADTVNKIVWKGDEIINVRN